MYKVVFWSHRGPASVTHPFWLILLFITKSLWQSLDISWQDVCIYHREVTQLFRSDSLVMFCRGLRLQSLYLYASQDILQTDWHQDRISDLNFYSARRHTMITLSMMIYSFSYIQSLLHHSGQAHFFILLSINTWWIFSFSADTLWFIDRWCALSVIIHVLKSSSFSICPGYVRGLTINSGNGICSNVIVIFGAVVHWKPTSPH